MFLDLKSASCIIYCCCYY